MNSELESIIRDTESKFSDLDRNISNKINDEQSKIDGFKRKIKKSIIGLLIIASLSYISVEAYKFKKKQDILFESSRYYQVIEGDTLETIAEKICNDSYNLNKIIKFNKKFDENFDSIAEKGEIIHFPKKYIKNSEQLINFLHEKTQLNENIQKNKNLVEITFNGNITKQSIDRVYDMVAELDSNLEKLKTLKQDNYFNKDVILLLNQISGFKENIKNKLNSEIGKIDAEFRSINNTFYNSDWKKPGTIEKLDELMFKNNKIIDFYNCFRQHDKVVETEIIKQKIKSTKENYLIFLDKLREDISKDKYTVDNLQKQLDPLLRLGIQNKELPLIKELREKVPKIKFYNEWKSEKRLEEQVNEYSSKINKLNFEVNNKFNYAVGVINQELREYEKEISDAEKLNRLDGADTRLKYLIKNPLAMVKYRYQLLDYEKGIERTDNLINKIDFFIKN